MTKKISDVNCPSYPVTIDTNRFSISFFLKIIFLLVFISVTHHTLPGPLLAQDSIQKSVVKIITTRRMPDSYRPWMKGTPQEVSGSGVIIDGKRILTNSHVVAYASQIYVQPHQSDKKINASVLAEAPGVDLALLEIEDKDLISIYPHLALDEKLPKAKDTVNVYGYPIGGRDQSVTEGIISRIDYDMLASPLYGQDLKGLRIQVDAALNPGNSGGPAIIGNNIVGIVNSKIFSAENIGYLIPVEEIRMFLEDIADGTYDGKPRFQGFFFQTCENDALRALLELTDDATGLLVSRIQEGCADIPLHVFDLITHIGSYPIDNAGYIRVHEDLRLPAEYLVPRLTENGMVPVTLLRKNRTISCQIPVSSRSKQLVRYEKNEYPSYFIFGPMVFTPVTSLNRNLFSRIPGNPIAERFSDLMTFEGEELVALIPSLFSHQITKGYSPKDLYGVISHVNQVKIKNLSHLVALFRDLKDEYIIIKFASLKNETMVFRRKDLASATNEILDDNGIRNQYSKDLQSLWEPTAGR